MGWPQPGSSDTATDQPIDEKKLRAWQAQLGPPDADRPDLIVTRARTFNELLSRPQADRIVLVAGRQIDTTLPDYRELDRLMGGAGADAR